MSINILTQNLPPSNDSPLDYQEFVTAFLITGPLNLAEATPQEIRAWLIGQVSAAQAIVDALDHRLWVAKTILEGLIRWSEELDRRAGGVR